MNIFNKLHSGYVLKSFRKVVYVFCLMFLVAISIRLFVGEPCNVPSESMEPAILAGDWLWIDKISYGSRLPERWADIPLVNIFTYIPALRHADEQNNWGYHRVRGFRDPVVGDIVVFNSPSDEEVLLVKRVTDIYNKGDTVFLTPDNQNLLQQIIQNEKVNIDKTRDDTEVETYYVLTQNYYCLLGDNRGNSHDSRAFGYIPEKLIEGKVNRTLMSVGKDSLGKSEFRFKRIFFKLK